MVAQREIKAHWVDAIDLSQTLSYLKCRSPRKISPVRKANVVRYARNVAYPAESSTQISARISATRRDRRRQDLSPSISGKDATACTLLEDGRPGADNEDPAGHVDEGASPQL